MAQSARLAFGNLVFLFKNPSFGMVPATIYLMTAWLVGAAAGGVAPSNPWQALRVTVDAFSTHPGLALWCGGIVMAFLAFTDTHSRVYRVLGGAAAFRGALQGDVLHRLGRARRGHAVAARRRRDARGAGGRRHVRGRVDCRLGRSWASTCWCR